MKQIQLTDDSREERNQAPEPSLGLAALSHSAGRSIAIENLMEVAKKELGAEVTLELRRYFSQGAKLAGRETHQGLSGDCWINAAENFLLKNDRELLAVAFQRLIEQGFMIREDFQHPDEADPVLGARRGASLAFDRAINRRFGTTYGANDFQIEQFESFIRQTSTVAVFNGRGMGSEGRDMSADLRRLLQHPSAARGVRCSIEWLQGSDHVFHQVTIEEVKNGRVYFYQSLSDPSIKGPRRSIHDKTGLESMALDDFVSLTRVAFIPMSLANSFKLERNIDPAYGSEPAQGSERVFRMVDRAVLEDPLFFGAVFGSYPKRDTFNLRIDSAKQENPVTEHFTLLGLNSVGIKSGK